MWVGEPLLSRQEQRRVNCVRIGGARTFSSETRPQLSDEVCCTAPSGGVWAEEQQLYLVRSEGVLPLVAVRLRHSQPRLRDAKHVCQHVTQRPSEASLQP